MYPKRVQCFVIALASIMSGCGGKTSQTNGVASAQDRSFDYVSFDISRNGKTIVFCSTTCDLFTYNLLTKKIVRLTNTKDISETNPNISPDGKSIVFNWLKDSADRSCIGLMSINGTNKKQLTNQREASDGSPSFSMDGKKITFLRANGIRDYAFGGKTRNKYDVYVMQTSDHSIKRLTYGNYWILDSPRFYNKDKSVLFIQFMPEGVGQPSLYQVDVASRKLNSWVNTSIGSRTATTTGLFVSDNSELAVVVTDRERAYQSDLSLINTKTRSISDLKITDETNANRAPVITSDGKYVYYLTRAVQTRSDDERMDLWRVDVKTKKRQKVTDSSVFDR